MHKFIPTARKKRISLRLPPKSSFRLCKTKQRQNPIRGLIAGSDTTVTTLTYDCVHLAHKPELWEQIYQEILPLYKDKNVVPRPTDLENLPLLTACLKESECLKFYSAPCVYHPLATHHLTVRLPQVSASPPPSLLTSGASSLLPSLASRSATTLSHQGRASICQRGRSTTMLLSPLIRRGLICCAGLAAT